MLISEKLELASFTIDTFDSLFDGKMNNANIEATTELAVSSPLRLYYFMQRYTYFDSFAGSLAARLASAIGLSYDLFRCSEEPVLEQSDRGLVIAAKIFAAAIDEHADSKAHNVPHRTLAQATLKAISDYAELSDIECNQISQNPQWLETLVTKLIAGYEGKVNDLEALVTAAGFHLASELLAVREYSIIDKVVRYTHRGLGFDAWLQGKKIEIGVKRLSPWFWITVHGKHIGLGVEAEHRDMALEALNLIARYYPESNEKILKWASKGFLGYANLQNTLYLEIQNELTTIV